MKHIIERIRARFRKLPRPSKRLLLAISTVIIVVWIFNSVLNGGFPRVDRSSYQAVFLSNDQVYFGKLKNYNREYVTLTDIYYLQVSQQLQQEASLEDQQAQGFSLVKFGNELHGPQDRMFIARDSILFWENLKDDSLVSQAITNQNRTN